MAVCKPEILIAGSLNRKQICTASLEGDVPEATDFVTYSKIDNLNKRRHFACWKIVVKRLAFLVTKFAPRNNI
jgi:hypothetical protein